MKKMFLVGAAVAAFAFVGCSSEKDVNMTETSDCGSCAKSSQCESTSPGVVGEKSSCSETTKAHCEGQSGECPFSKQQN
ncbi:MAG: hypothetical protein KJZ69_08035 [Phycisphaerales bacterium]|nr:hypothetical protein [Phycisphaerales bacterium]